MPRKEGPSKLVNPATRSYAVNHLQCQGGN